MRRFDLSEAWAKAPADGSMATAVLHIHLQRAGRNSNNILQARLGIAALNRLGSGFMVRL